MGEHDTKRSKQTSTKQRQMERKIENLPGNSKSDGKTVERIRIVFASELSECECCGEPWRIVHMEHYAECNCIGPHNAEEEGYEIIDDSGTLYAVKR